MLGTGQQCIVQYGHVVCHCLPACCTYLITCPPPPPPHPPTLLHPPSRRWRCGLPPTMSDRQVQEQDTATEWQHLMAGISQ
jgi:hypothetical protein